MNKAAIVGLTLLASVSIASATESIRSVSADGEIVILENGDVWEIDGVDRIDTQLWLPTDDVIERSFDLIHVDDGEIAHGRRLR